MRSTYLLLLCYNLSCLPTFSMHPHHQQLSDIFNAPYDTTTAQYNDMTWHWQSTFTKSPPGRIVTLEYSTPWRTQIIVLSGTYGALRAVTTRKTFTTLSKILAVSSLLTGVAGVMYYVTQHSGANI